MNYTEILQSSDALLHSLDALKNEHEKLLSNISSTKLIDDQLDLIRKSMEMIDLGIGEVEVIRHLGYYLENFRAEHDRLQSQVKRLCQENAWLRDELGSTQKKLHECEQTNAAYVVEIEHLQFLKHIQESLHLHQPSTTNTNHSHNDDLVKDLFPSDDEEIDEERENNHHQDSERPTAELSSIMMNGSLGTSTCYDMPARFQTLHNLVHQYASQGRYELAVPLCRQALEELEKTSGHQHPDVATLLNILALVYRDQSKFKEAIALLNDALAIREKTLGIDHPAVAATLNNLAVLYGKRHKYREAETLCKRALEIREKHLGHSHPDIAKQINNLALICHNQGKYDEVERYYQRVIEIYQQHFGPNDLNLIRTKINLAFVYFQQEKCFQSEQLYKDILLSNSENDLLITLDIPTLISILKNLSLLYRRQGRFDVADTLLHSISDVRQDPRLIYETLRLI